MSKIINTMIFTVKYEAPIAQFFLVHEKKLDCNIISEFETMTCFELFKGIKRFKIYAPIKLVIILTIVIFIKEDPVFFLHSTLNW